MLAGGLECSCDMATVFVFITLPPKWCAASTQHILCFVLDSWTKPWSTTPGSQILVAREPHRQCGSCLWMMTNPFAQTVAWTWHQGSSFVQGLTVVVVILHWSWEEEDCETKGETTTMKVHSTKWLGEDPFWFKKELRQGNAKAPRRLPWTFWTCLALVNHHCPMFSHIWLVRHSKWSITVISVSLDLPRNALFTTWTASARDFAQNIKPQFWAKSRLKFH